MTTGPERWLAPILLALALSACGTKQVMVQSEFPPPVMNKLPLTIGVWYDDEFANHEFFDEASGRAESSWLVNTGQAQVELWDTLLKGMFREVVYMNGKPGPGQMNPVVAAVNLAAVMALRDAGAHFASSFTRVPAVAQWLDSLPRAGEPARQGVQP